MITTQNRLWETLWAFDLELFQYFWASASLLYEDVAAIVIETRWCVHCVIYHLSSAPLPPLPTLEQKSDVNVVRAMTSRCEYVTTAATYPEKAKLVSVFADQHQL